MSIARVIAVKIDNSIYKKIDDIISGKYNKNILIEKLGYIVKYLKEKFEPEVVKYLKSIKLWPAPKKYMNGQDFTFYI